MISSRKHKLLIALILVCTCGVVLSAEPNEVRTELKFDIRKGPSPARHLKPRAGTPDVYSHFAVLFVRGKWRMYQRGVPIEAMLETSAGQSMSQMQRDVISNQAIKYLDDGATISNYTYFQLFGISEDDVQKMVNAFIESLANRNNKEMQNFLSKQQEYQEKIADIKKKLLEKQAELESTQTKLDTHKTKVRYLSADEAKATVLELNKTLDTLEVEIVGLQARIEANGKYRFEKGNRLSDEALAKLEQMKGEDIISLAGALARKKAALRIRNREKEFLDLFSQWSNLDSEVNRLKHDLETSENNLLDVEKILANPVPEMLPPKVLQNKVMIYPVRAEN